MIQKTKKNLSLYSVAVLFAVTLTGCAVDITNYTDNRPEFDLFEYFTGETRGWGIVQDRKGELLRQFVVDIQGTLNPAGELVLAEKFHWNDGETSERTWIIGKGESSALTGTAEDVIGTATGRVAGNALNWGYQVEVPVAGRTWNITFDDWMFLQPDGVLLNRAEMSKFGIRVGDVTIAFMKKTTQED